MASVQKKSGAFSLRAYRGDAKTLLAFDLTKAGSHNLAGFTIQCKPPGVPAYYLFNTLTFEKPDAHAQDPLEPARSSINAPFHKFRWLHVPGSVHQGTKPVFGKYTYTVTPRYFNDAKSMQPLDPGQSLAVSIEVGPFMQGAVELGFTRGYVQSQGFVNNFGKDAKIRPADKTLVFDLTKQAGVNDKGTNFTFEEEYQWLGFTARERILGLLDDVIADKKLHLDVFAYDLNAPDVIAALLKLAKQGRVRIILDNAGLHHSAKTPKPEDEFEKLCNKQNPGANALLRGKFGRYSHDKVFIVSNAKGPQKVLTGSTNFSVTGLYVNSNHVLVFSDPKVAATYQDVFDKSWAGGAKLKAFMATPIPAKTFAFGSQRVPRMEITFSPHSKPDATRILDGLAARVKREGTKGKQTGSVLFAVMQVDGGTSQVWTALKALHANEKVFSFGISDTAKGVQLYKPGRRTGVLVTGKPGKTTLPPPFNQVPAVSGHQVHHKFVVCGFNQPDAVVYCGSSNLAQGGEEANGDNLLAIHDVDIATAFAIEALGLVDHFNFLGNLKTKSKPGTAKTPPASPQNAAAAVGWHLSTGDGWTKPYFDPKDLHCVDRELFA